MHSSTGKMFGFGYKSEKKGGTFMEKGCVMVKYSYRNVETAVSSPED